MSPESQLFLVLDLTGTFAFALNGALVAIRVARLDVVGVVTLGMITALGGGILRDVLLGSLPPATFDDWRYLTVALVGSLVACGFGLRLERLAVPILVLDAAGLSLFAVSGASKALDLGMGPVQAIILGAVTAVGGGTVRDLVLGRDVFWVSRPGLVLLAAAAAFIVFWTAHLVESRYRWLLWLDAMALSVAVPAGVGVALAGGSGPVIVVIAGIVTGSFGGLMRDVVGNEVPLVLKQGELYLTAAFGGAVLALILIWLGMPRPVASDSTSFTRSSYSIRVAM